MKLTIEPTEDFFVADDVMVRMWTGTDDNGTPVVALVAAVAVNDGSPRAPMFDGQLTPIPPPTPEDARRWAEKIMADKSSDV